MNELQYLRAIADLDVALRDVILAAIDESEAAGAAERYALLDTLEEIVEDTREAWENAEEEEDET